MHADRRHRDPRVVLGVCGGHRRLQGGRGVPPPRRRRRARDARAHRRRHAVRRRGHLLRAGLRAGAALAVGRVLAHPAHAARPGRRPRRGRAGHRPHPRPLRRRALRRPAVRHAARHPGAGDRVPGHAHRDVGARLGAGQPRHARAPRRRDRPAGERAARRRRLGRGHGWPTRASSSNACSNGWAAATRRDLHGARVVVSAGRHPGAPRPCPLHHEPLVGEAGPRDRRRGGPARRGGHARHVVTAGAPARRRGVR